MVLVTTSSSSSERVPAIEFLIQSAQLLQVPPIVKYSALSLFADRFLPSLPADSPNWLLQPLTESALQLFVLMSLWISSKMHDTQPLSATCLKSLADKSIKEQHYTTRNFIEAEMLFMQVLNFEIGTTNITFVYLEELWIQFKGVTKVGELIDFDVCMDVMDLLYEKEETSFLYRSPHSLAASILVVSYIITVPKQKWEFPVLAWVNFVTSYKEEDIMKRVMEILKHVLEPS
ncbi:cyclin-J18 isoform X2 [Lotus japonicus]|uniref:cyclin-J18 isoform X2 n=1 Tax=Lotus japonicus TaxID=34305 RepID=UPI00258E31E8|nr:cyclin-J18 isoform X2 [Lotus japonicus]